MNNLVSPQATQVITFGRERYWGFRVAEGVGILEEETYQNGWWYLPTEDSSQYQKASKRIEEVKKNFKIQQVIIAHEAPFLLCAPKTPVEKTKDVNTTKTAVYAAGGLLAGAGVVVAGVMVAVALMYLLIPLMMGLAVVALFGLGVLVDPVAIVVLSDGTRVEVMRWID